MDDTKPQGIEQDIKQASENHVIAPSAYDLSSPLKLLAITACVVACSEIIIDFVINDFRYPFDARDAIIDVIVTTFLVFLLLYFLVFKEMRSQLQQLKEMENSLRQSEADYRGIIQDQTEFICQFNQDGKITFANDAFCRFFSCPMSDCLQMEFSKLFSPEDKDQIKSLVFKLSQHQPSASTESRLEMQAGSIRWSSWTIHAIYRGQDELIHYQAVGRDITEYKHLLQELQESRDELELKVQQRTTEMAMINRELRTEIATRQATETALQASESHLQQVIDQLPAVLWTVDTSLGITSLLGSRLPQFQSRIEQVLNSGLQADPTADEASNPIVQAHTKALNGQRGDFELHLDQHDFHCTVQPFHSPEGEITGCLGLAVDITDRKQSEDLIRRQHTALEAAPDGIIIANHDGIIQWANPAMTLITGYPITELIGNQPSIFNSGQHPKEFFKNLWDTILSGRVWY